MMDANVLESEIDDLRNLTFACREIIERKIRHTPRAPRINGFSTILLNDDELNAVFFMVNECESRARLLDQRFQAALLNEKGAK